jgi:hypothetical protein
MVVDKAVDGAEGDGDPPEIDALPVRVVARARPLLPSEAIHSSRSCIAFDKGEHLLENVLASPIHNGVLQFFQAMPKIGTVVY